jgi:oxygen-dependent protoporphyrinogen oxidase
MARTKKQSTEEVVREKIGGFGFLVPRRAEIKLLGCLYMSQLFPSRAPAGRELLQCIAGGARWPEAVDLSDDEIAKQVCADLDQIIGLRERQAIPQPKRDHVARIARVRKRLAEFPNIALAGAYLGGISVSDALESGLIAARDVS